MDRHFRSIPAMLQAEPEEWSKIPGIGKKLAIQTYEVLHGNANSNS